MRKTLLLKSMLIILLFASSISAEMTLFGSNSLFEAPVKEEENKQNEGYTKAIEFADFLYNEGEFADASKEYLKLYFTNKNDSLLKRTAIAFYAAENYTMAETYLKKSFEIEQSQETYTKLFSIYETNEDYTKALELSKQIGDESSWFQSKYFYLLGKQDSAKSYLEKNGAPKYSVNSDAILELMQRDIPQKNRGIGFAASLLPGGGYLYTERYGDALFTNLIVIPLAIVSGLYYVNDEKTKAYVWGGIGGIFYLGSIYGGVKSVSDYNEQIEIYRDHKIKDNYSTKDNNWIIEH